MKRIIPATVTAITAISTVIVFESAVAHASSSNNVVGQKYSDARSALTGAGYAIVVSTTVGDNLGRSDCVVTRQQSRIQPPPENTSAAPVKQMLLSLNCGAAVATAVTPGNSRQSPEGRAAAAAAAAAAAKANAKPAPDK